MAAAIDWTTLLGAAKSDLPLEADVYIAPLKDSYAMPRLYRVADGREFAVKLPAPVKRRALISDHLVARLGVMIDAPVPAVFQVDVPPEMLPADEVLEAAGVAHALDYLGSVTDDGIQWVEGNEGRFGALAVFYTWLGTPDCSQYQLTYERRPRTLPRMFSVDHGAFLQPANVWNAASVGRAPMPKELDPWCMRSQVGPEHLQDAAVKLDQCTPEQIAEAAAALPDSWDVTGDERVALCEFAWNRRSATLKHLGGGRRMSRRVIYYSIVQVVPDAARGERMNIGAVAWDPAAECGAARFSSFKRRLQALGVDDPTFAEEFRDWLTDALEARGERLFVPGARAAESRWDVESMRMATAWGGMIQFTDIRPARGDSARDVAQMVYERSVRLAATPLREVTKDAVRRGVAAQLRHAIQSHFPTSPPPLSVKTRFEVIGARASHNFDVAVLNGRVAAAVVTPNFENPKTADVIRDLEAATWAVMDVRAAVTPIRFAIAAPTTPTSKRVRAAVDILAADGAAILREPAAWQEWAADLASTIPDGR